MTETENGGDIEAAYRRVFEDIDPAKRVTMLAIDRILSVAYNCITYEDGRGNSHPENQVAAYCGCLAECYMATFDRLCEALGGDESHAIGVISKTAEWMRKNGWHGTPEYVNRDGKTVSVTASGMHTRMLANLRRVREFRKILQEGKTER